MPNNKNQHFVPRCLLRPFSLDGNGKAISLYNARSQKHIFDAPLKHQCSRDNFYRNESELQVAIKGIEDMYAAVRDRILSPQAPIESLDPSLLGLLSLCWLFQHVRTEAACKHILAMSTEMRDKARMSKEESDFSLTDAIDLAMESFARNMDISEDYSTCIVKNDTPQPFVISDDPAILTNRWFLQDERNRHRAFGHGSAGNIILLPISPTRLFLGYDSDVYRIRETQGWVKCTSISDVLAFNQHQYLNYHSNIYFDRNIKYHHIADQIRDCAHLKPPQRHQTNVAVASERGDDYTRYELIRPSELQDGQDFLIHSQAIRPKPNRWPSLIGWRRGGTYFSNDTGKGFLRKAIALRENNSGQPFTKREIRKISWT